MGKTERYDPVTADYMTRRSRVKRNRLVLRRKEVAFHERQEEQETAAENRKLS